MPEEGTLLGPLTTTWTQPPSCSTLYFGVGPVEVFRGQTCLGSNGGEPGDNPNCWPPRKGGVPDHSRPFFGWGFYSPGVVCPSGYTTACTAVYGKRPDWEVQYSIFSGETAIGCCPSGYACARNFKGSNTCSIVITTPTTVPSARCAGTDVTSSGMKVFPDIVATTTSLPDGGVVTTTTTRTVTLFAHMFQLNYQASDLVSATASTPPTVTTPAPTTTNTSAASQNSELSTGAKAGIGIGVGLGGILILALLAIFFRRMRKSGKESGENYLEGAEGGTKERRFGAGSGTRAPASGKWATQELHGHPAPTELPSQPPVELPASVAGHR